MGGRGSTGWSNANMPELKGSEKQIRWANDIRSSALDVAEMNIRNARKNEKLGLGITYLNPSVKSTNEVRDMLRKLFQSQTSAKEIIDKRDGFSQNSLKNIAAEIDRMKGRRNR